MRAILEYEASMSRGPAPDSSSAIVKTDAALTNTVPAVVHAIQLGVLSLDLDRMRHRSMLTILHFSVKQQHTKMTMLAFCTRSVRHLVTRHEALRTVFHRETQASMHDQQVCSSLIQFIALYAVLML